MSKSSHRLLGDLTSAPDQKLQLRVRHLGATLQEGSLLEVGAIPQLPFANAIALLVPNTSSMACPQKSHTSASAISLLIPDQPHQKHVEGGLTPLTPDLLILRQNVTFNRTSE